MCNNNYHLTKREAKILKLIGEGFGNGEISEKIFISKRTIEVHKNNIVKKLQLKSASELTHYAILNKDKIKCSHDKKAVGG